MWNTKYKAKNDRPENFSNLFQVAHQENKSRVSFRSPNNLLEPNYKKNINTSHLNDDTIINCILVLE